MSNHFIKLSSDFDEFNFSALHLSAQGERKGGVVLLHEILGLDEFTRNDCAGWAADGFEVIAPSLFDRQEPGFQGRHVQEDIVKGMGFAAGAEWETAAGDIRACIEFFGEKPGVFLLGYCYGGSLAWKAAAEIEGIDAVSSYYGSAVQENAFLKPLCPVICHFGEQDGFIPSRAVAQTLSRTRPEVPVYLYPNSGHGFHKPGLPDSDPAEAALARARTIGLFTI